MRSVLPRKLLTVMFAGVLVMSLVYKFYRGANSTSDFTAFWYSGRALNMHLDPYLSNPGIAVPGVGHDLPFWSPIFLAELMRPLSLMGFHQAKLIWMLISTVLGTVSVWLLMVLSKIERSRKNVVLMLGVVLSLNSTVYVLGNGQTDMLVLFSVILSWILLEKKFFFYSGISLCVGAVNPHLILGIVLYYLFRVIRYGEYGLLWGGVSGATFLILVSIPYGQYGIEWLSKILPYAQTKGVNYSGGQITVVHILHALHMAHSTLIAICLSIIATVWTIISWSNNRNKDSRKDMGMAAVLTLFIATFAFNQDFVLLFLAVPMIVVFWTEQRYRASIACALSVSLLCSGMTGFLVPFRHNLFEVLAPLGTLFMLLLWNPNLRKQVFIAPYLCVSWLVLTIGGYFVCNVYLANVNLSSSIILAGLIIFLVVGAYSGKHSRRLLNHKFLQEETDLAELMSVSK